MKEHVEIMKDGKLDIRIPDQARQGPVLYDHLHKLDISREVQKLMKVFAEMYDKEELGTPTKMLWSASVPSSTQGKEDFLQVMHQGLRCAQGNYS